MNAAVTLAYKGITIRDRNEMLNLTDMWRAQGSPPNMEPFNWARFEGKAFIEAVAIAHNLSANQVMTKKRGKSGATWAHWQAGIAYAKYLSHDFHMWANKAVRERMEGRSVPVINPETFAHQFMIAVEQRVSAFLASQCLMQDPGLTAGDVLDLAGVSHRKGLKGLAGFLSRRLERWHLQRGIPLRLGRLGRMTAKLFDPAATKAWLDAGGKREIEDWIKERVGQGKLFSIVPKKDEPK